VEQGEIAPMVGYDFGIQEVILHSSNGYLPKQLDPGMHQQPSIDVGIIAT